MGLRRLGEYDMILNNKRCTHVRRGGKGPLSVSPAMPEKLPVSHRKWGRKPVEEKKAWENGNGFCAA